MGNERNSNLKNIYNSDGVHSVDNLPHMEEKMNRRNFLKSLGAVCGAAVVAPTALLEGKDGNLIEGITCYGKHGQCACNSCVLDLISDNLPPLTFRGIPIVYRSPLYDETIQTTK